MTRKTLVVGAGVAGLAAAWSARRRGHEVTVIDGGVGASGLSSGALDWAAWDDPRAVDRLAPIAPDVRELLELVSIWRLCDDKTALLATTAGCLRPARGHDRALLDLAALEKARVLVPRVARAGWDADAIAATLSDDPRAKAREIAFVAIDLPVLRHESERRISDLDLAAHHDQDDRVAWLAARLRDGLANDRASAVLVGPWLGARSPRAETLSDLVGVPIGEALVGIGSPAGLRFEAARDRVLTGLGARSLRGRVIRVVHAQPLFTADLADGAQVKADGVVLAVGGLVGGGIVYDPPEHDAGGDLPPRGRAAYRLSLAIDLELALRGRSIDVVSSLHGPRLDEIAWPSGGRTGALEAIGVRAEGVLAAPGIAVAGDALADRPRTMLEAIASGIRAGACV